MFSSRKVNVLLDTNVLLLPARGVDVFSGIEGVVSVPFRFCTLSCILDELLRLSQGNGRDSFAAKLGFVLVKQKDLKIIRCSSDKHPDDVIVEVADPESFIVATQDKALIKRLRSKGVRVLRFQQGVFRFYEH